jgi:hypothetical protein
MSLVLDGTNGLSDVDGSAATPAIRGTDTNTGIFFPAADTIAFAEGGVESMRLDSNGNLGLGVTPSAWASNRRTLEIGGNTVANLALASAISEIYVNTVWNGSTNTYRNNGPASWWNFNNQSSGGWAFNIAPSGTAGNAISFTQVMTLDASGNLGVGTSSPAARLQVTKNAADVARFTNSLSNGGDWEFKIGGGGFEDRKLMITDKFGGADNVRLAVDSSGNLLVGRTDTAFTSGQPGMCVLPTQGITFTKTTSPNLGACMYLHRTFGAGTGNLVEFAYDTVVRGSISTNGSSTSYNTSSDYRLKHDIQPMTGALAKVQQLKPVTYKWNIDDSESQGFIAHELQEVVPDCVTGEKDAVDAEGNPQYQGIDTSFLVATLTAAIQEQQDLIQTLTARVTALEGTQP